MYRPTPLNNPYLALWALSLLLLPFHVFGKTPVLKAGEQKASDVQQLSKKVEGGMPQPSDFVAAALMLLVFTGRGFYVESSELRLLRAFGAFALYVTLINLVWSWAADDFGIGYYSLFYVYDFLLLLTLVLLYSRFKEHLLRVTFYCLVATVFIQLLLSPLVHDAGSLRQRLFFNNDNHLGYYTVLMGCFFWMYTRHMRVHVALQVSFYGAVVYLSMLSVSRASILALLLLFVLILAERPWNLAIAAAVGGVLLLASSLVAEGSSLSLEERVLKRLASEGKEESLEMRGYDRLGNHPQYLILGAGEGGYYRFQSVWPRELHSSFGTLVFCYGIVGTMLFVYGVMLACRFSLTWALCLAPVFLFGMAHQGLRFSTFWIVLGSLYCIARPACRYLPSLTLPRQAPAPACSGL
jgi:hypothetical protein